LYCFNLFSHLIGKLWPSEGLSGLFGRIQQHVDAVDLELGARTNFTSPLILTNAQGS
jgi:hypothetical protein